MMSFSETKPNEKELKILHKTIKKITEDIETLSLNTAISTFMISINDLIKQRSTSKKVFEELLVLMSPFAPHFVKNFGQF